MGLESLQELRGEVLSKYENQITIFTDYLEEFPDADELVWILGKQHLLKTEKMCCTLPLSADTAAESAPDSLNASTQRRGPSACRPAWKPLLLIVPLRLGINQINPVYVDAFKGFFCKEEKDFDSWCSLVQKEILKENLRMFELVQKHPSHWPPFVPPAKPEVTTTGAEFIDSTEQLEEFDLEEDFEILSI
ncbi:hypothetical protein CB1_001991001 [Camelus ferus]|nr:hypothetical protein CB1_001991001 [Camelus ferus]